MKALLLVREPHPEWSFLGHDRTPVLLPFLDRPMLQHVVESLVARGCTEIGLIVMTAIEPIRALVGEGRRWGAKITVLPLRDMKDVEALATTFVAYDEPVMVGDAERLPTEWPVVTAPEIPVVLGARKARPDKVTLDASTPDAYMESWRRVVTNEISGLVRTGRETAKDVIVGRGAKIHPAALVVGPAYIGERCLIGAGAQVGPFAYIGADSIVEDEAQVLEGAVLPHTYVGPRLEIRRKFVFCSTAYDLDRKVAIDTIEEFLLGGTKRSNGAPGLRERALAFAGGVVLLPVSVFGALASLLKQTPADEIGMRTVAADFALRVAPGMWSVVFGRRHLVGAPSLDPSSRRGVEQLAPGLLSMVPEGLISDAYVRFGPRPTLDELWASVAFSAAARDQKSRLSLVTEYLAAAFGLSRPEWTKGQS